MHRRGVQRLVCLYILGNCLVAAAGELYRGPYLQQATPNSVIVVWRTEGPSQPVLRYGDAPGALVNEVSGDAILVRASADAAGGDDVPVLFKESPEQAAERDSSDPEPSTRPNTYQYEAKVTGLRPASKHYYGVFDGKSLLAGGDEDHYFITSQPHGSETELRVWVVGDSGTGDQNQRSVHEAMQAFTASTGRPLDIFMHVGDMAYGDGTDWEFQHRFFEPYQETLRNTVCWPTMGNHEGHTSRGISGIGPYYDAYVLPTAGEVGGAPSGSEAYYAFDIGRAHFICLDSHDLDRTPSGAMAQWLRADLDRARADWLIAFWHHPPYTKGSHDSDRERQLIEMREHLMPILEGGGVDLVLTGHSHIYERSMLMDGAYATPTTADGVILDDGDGRPDGDGPYRKSAGLQPHEGSVSIVSGHGGAGLSRSGTMPVMREIIIEHGSVILDIDGDTMVGRMVDRHGDVRDMFSIVKRGTVEVARVENPWQPPHDFSLVTDHYFDFASAPVGKLPDYWVVRQGNAENVTIVEDPGANHNVLSVRTGTEPAIGIFDPVASRGFEFDTFLRIPGNGDRVAGLVFGYLDNDNYCRVVFDTAEDVIRTVRVEDGEERVVSTRDAELPRGAWLKLELDSVGRRIQIQFQDGLTYRVEPFVSLPDAKFGFYVAPGSAADYRLFSLEVDL